MSDATLVAAAPTARPTPWRPVLLAAAVAGSLWFLVSAALPYLALDPQQYGRYWPRRGWLLAHIAGGIVALLAGPVQVWLGLARRRLGLHRVLGRVYASGVALGSLAAVGLALKTDVGWVFAMGLLGLATAWILTTGMAVVAIKRRLIEQHQEWMIRSYVTTLGFVTFRLFFDLLSAANVGTAVERLNAASWFCWAVPLLVTEVVLQGGKVLAPALRTRS